MPTRPSIQPRPSAAFVAAAGPVRGWPEDLRFFLTAYAAGLVFFLIMLS